MSSRSIYILVVLIFPLLTILFFSSLFRDGVPGNMPIAIVDLDQTVTSRKFARAIDATATSEVTMHLQSETEAMSELRSGNIYGFVVLPDNLQADILLSNQPVISYYYQNSFLSAGGLIQSDLSNILYTLSAGIKIQKLEEQGQVDDISLSQVQPVRVSTHLLFNPTSNYAVYITSIALPIMLQIFILLMTVYSIGVEIKEKTSHDWLRLSDKSVAVALAGKLLPYTAMFFIVMMFQNFILYKMMHIPLHTSIGWLMAGSLLFVLSCQAVGVLFVGLLPVMRHAINLSAFYGILAFSLCGFSFPVESMPPVVQYWTALFPVRQYMHIFHSQILSGFEFRYTILSYLHITLFLLLPFIILTRLKSALIYQNFIETFQSYTENQV